MNAPERAARAGFRFRPSLVPTLAALATMCLTLALMRWQLNRADEKLARQQSYLARHELPMLRLDAARSDPEAVLYRRISAKGQFEPSRLLFIDNRVHQGRVGFHALAPLRLASGDRVLVNLGWIARGREYPAAPPVAVQTHELTVTGSAVIPSKRYLELTVETTRGNVWQNLDVDRISKLTGVGLLPFVLNSSVPLGTQAPVSEMPESGPK